MQDVNQSITFQSNATAAGPEPDMRITIAILALVGSLSGFAFPEASFAGEGAEDPRVEIAKKLGARPEELQPSPIDGLYEFSQGADIAYVTRDGQYLLSGDLFEIKSRANLTDARRKVARQRLIDAVPESEMVVFGAPNAKYTLTVFTDVDCSYCRKLHSQIAEINRLGMRVRYLFYPRSGPGSASWRTAEAVWCSNDRNAALTSAKRGEQITSKKCGPTPVRRQYELGHDLGLQGTPGIFMPNGDYLPGYLPPAQLLEQAKLAN